MLSNPSNFTLKCRSLLTTKKSTVLSPNNVKIFNGSEHLDEVEWMINDHVRSLFGNIDLELLL